MKKKKIVLLGLDFGSKNLGCAALAYSFLYILEVSTRCEEIYLDIVSVNYNSFNRKEKKYQVRDMKIHYKNIIFYKSYLNELKQADFIFDFTGGDSFTDLYGLSRFIKESILKQISILKRKVFILGPQTIGPFQSIFAIAWAKKILNKSKFVFVRDQLSYNYAKQKMGCNPLLTTDIAFLLPADYEYIKWKPNTFGKLRIGINVSGLMWNGGYTKDNAFGLVLDYQTYCRKIIKQCIMADMEVHLIGHVFSEQEDSPENDYKVLKILKSEFPKTIMASQFQNPMQAKAYMGGMDFFIGSRMHATIGAFSMGVPTISVSYSRKFDGLYNSIEYPYVIDCKKYDIFSAVELTEKWIQNRKELKQQLKLSIDIVREKNEVFISSIKHLILN